MQAPAGLIFVIPFITLAFGFMTIARLAIADALATLTTILLYVMLFRGKVHWLLLICSLVIFIRTDLILLLALFHAYLLFTARASKGLVIFSGVATVAAYLFLNHVIVESDPWTSLLGYSLGEKPTHPEKYNFPISFTRY